MSPSCRSSNVPAVTSAFLQVFFVLIVVNMSRKQTKKGNVRIKWLVGKCLGRYPGSDGLLCGMNRFLTYSDACGSFMAP